MSWLTSIFKPLAYLSLPIFLLRSVANSSPIGRYYVRLAAYIGALVSVSTLSLISSATLCLLGRRYDSNRFVAYVFYPLVRRALDLRIEVEDIKYMDAAKPVVYMANHQSMLDVFVVSRLMPRQTSIMAKKELQYTPLGPLLLMSGALLIDRGNNARAIRSLEAAAEFMRTSKVSLWMFPEGTRHSSEIPDMLSMKKGGFHLAIQAGIPIVPIVTENYWRMYRSGVFDTGTLKVRVLPPIPTTGLTAADVPALATRVRDLMLEALRDISVKVPQEKQELHQQQQEQKHHEGSSVPNLASADVVPKLNIPTSGGIVDTPSPRGSSASLASTQSSGHSRVAISENGAETEEDEGMILVGRPQAA